MTVPAPFDGASAVRLVTAMFDAWRARDLPTMRSYLSPDYVQWHSNIQQDFTLEQHQAILAQVMQIMRIEYHDFTTFPFEGGVAMQCLADFLPNDGGEFRDVPTVLILRVRDGQVTRCDEYVDKRLLPDMEKLLFDAGT